MVHLRPGWAVSSDQQANYTNSPNFHKYLNFSPYAGYPGKVISSGQWSGAVIGNLSGRYGALLIVKSACCQGRFQPNAETFMLINLNHEERRHKEYFGHTHLWLSGC